MSLIAKKILLGAAGNSGNIGAWDLSYASLIAESFSVINEESNPSGLFFKPDGLKMYVVGFTGDDINEYNLATAWNVSTATYSQNFLLNGQGTTPHGVFFRDTGTSMYTTDYGGVEVNEYSLGSAWNVSTLSFVRRFSTTSQESSPRDVFFKPDGTRMYVVGDGSDNVNQYNLGTAFNTSTASFADAFGVGSQEDQPKGMFFRSDGTKFYLVGASGDDVNEYNLGTPWAINTASFVQNFSVASQEMDVTNVFFHPDGNKMFIIGRAQRTVFTYELSA
jgi:6-phosphogluconolactonase (cycloisomerase 2 family)